VADSPEALAKVLADLEARKESLRDELNRLDVALAEIHAKAELVVQPESHPEPEPVTETGFILQSDYSPAETPQAVRAPLPKAPPERRKEARLNIYVNQNADWASRQFVNPGSTKSVFRQKTGAKCPKCGSMDTRFSSSRGIADCFMFLFDYSVARCRSCDSRFRIWKNRPSGESKEAETKELEPQPSPASET
jgi:DNA-directed RNA polymerase subunit RPC12/RpoP